MFYVTVDIFTPVQLKLYPGNKLKGLQTTARSKTLTVEEVAAESRGKMPPQAMMRLSTTWEMRCILLWTNTTLSLLFTKSKIVFVE